MGDVLRRVRGFAVPIGVFLSASLPVFFAVAALGTRFGLWDWTFGLGFLSVTVGPILLVAAVLLGLASVLLAFLVSPRRGRLAAIIALAIPVAGSFGINQLRTAAGAVPPIHDISTDRQDPPTFSEELLRERGPDANPVLGSDAVIPVTPFTTELAGQFLADVQAAAYPDIVTIEVAMSRDQAYEASHAVVAAMGLDFVTEDPILGVMEATATTFWYGFKDDMVVRVRPSTEGALVDVRSVSRVGVSDLGANATRIREFREQLLRIVP